MIVAPTPMSHEMATTPVSVQKTNTAPITAITVPIPMVNARWSSVESILNAARNRLTWSHQIDQAWAQDSTRFSQLLLSKEERGPKSLALRYENPSLQEKVPGHCTHHWRWP